jgi:hypothetical protein
MGGGGLSDWINPGGISLDGGADVSGVPGLIGGESTDLISGGSGPGFSFSFGSGSGTFAIQPCVCINGPAGEESHCDPPIYGSLPTFSDSAISTGALDYQAYEGARLIRGLTPTVCGGGAFSFTGTQGEKGGSQGFFGYILDWDSRLGWSLHGLVEGGTHGAGGGVITNPLEGLFFLPAGEVPIYGVPVEFGGLVATSGAIGGFGEVGGEALGSGLGVYLNVSTVGGCTP